MHLFIRILLSLRFLPAGQIERAVDYMADKATTEATRGLLRAVDYMADKATTEATRGLLAYVRRQWLKNATFRVEDWLEYKQTVSTNNDVEGKDMCKQ